MIATNGKKIINMLANELQEREKLFGMSSAKHEKCIRVGCDLELT
jgi:hypothetical protein